MCRAEDVNTTSTSGRPNLDLDHSHPILFEVGLLGDSYMPWVHRPLHGQPRFFASPFLEHLTKTPWWVVPLMWTPLIAASLRITWASSVLQWPALLLLVGCGVLLWQFLEYCIHRYIFHAQPSSYWAVTFHFAFHGCHHKFPMDRERLVFPPLPAMLIAALIHGLLSSALPQFCVMPVFSGVLLGYLIYDCVHYAIHHARISHGWLASLKRAHLSHHFRSPRGNFGISSGLFDVLLRTCSAMPQ